MADNTIEIVIKAVDQMSSELGKTTGTVDALDRSLKRLQSTLAGTGRSLNPSQITSQVGAHIQQTQQTIQRLQQQNAALQAGASRIGGGGGGGGGPIPPRAPGGATAIAPGLGAATQQVGNLHSQIQAMNKGLAGTASAFKTASSAANLFWSAITAISIQQFLQGIIQTAVQLDKIQRFFEIAAGSAEAAAKDLAFVRAEAERLGLPFAALAESFGKFSVAANQAGFATAEVRQIFTGFTEALTVMNASQQDTFLVFLALEQMVSKGKVSMEELRRQLGERIPGVFQTAARAMGKTTEELEIMISKGQIAARDLLPKMSAELSKTFGPQVPAAAKDIQSAISRVTNAIFDLYTEMGKSGATEALRDALSSITKILGDPQVVANISAVSTALSNLIKIIVDNYKWFLVLGGALAALTGHWYLTAAAVAALTVAAGNFGDTAAIAANRLKTFGTALDQTKEAAERLSKETGISAQELMHMKPEELAKKLKEMKKDTSAAATEFQRLHGALKALSQDVTRAQIGVNISASTKQIDTLKTKISSSEDVIKAFGLNVDDFMNKPISELDAAIAKGGAGFSLHMKTRINSLRSERVELDKQKVALEGYKNELVEINKPVLKPGEVKPKVDPNAAKTLEKFIEQLEGQVIAAKKAEIAMLAGAEAGEKYGIALKAVEEGLVPGISLQKAMTMSANELWDKLPPKVRSLGDAVLASSQNMEVMKENMDRLAKHPMLQDFAALSEEQLEIADNIAKAQSAEIASARLQPTLVLQEGILDTLNQQLGTMEAQKAPASQLLATAGKIDDAERNVLGIKIKIAEAEIRALEAKVKTKEATELQVELAKAQLEILRGTQTGLNVQGRLRDIKTQAEDISADIADEFADNLVTAMVNKEADFQSFFAGIGRTIVTEVIEFMIKELLKQEVAKMLMNQGGGEVSTKGGIGGLLSTMVIGGGKKLWSSFNGPRSAFEDVAGPGTSNMDRADMEAGQLADTLELTNRVMEKTSEVTTDFGFSLVGVLQRLAGGGAGGDTFGTILGLAGKVFGAVSAVGGATAATGTAASAAGSSFAGGAGAFSGALGPGPSFGAAHGAIILGGGGNVPYSHPVMTNKMIHKFARGGRVMGGPVVGLLGEEGDEIVARMKPAGDRAAGKEQVINVHVWDKRPPSLTESDVLATVDKDMRHNGRLAKSTQQVMKRSR